MIFADRNDAGRQLARRLATEPFTDPIVLGLPRGGVPVAAHVARVLGAPLDVLVARKIGAPGHPEFGIGAVAEGSEEVVVTEAAEQLGLDPAGLARLAAAERAEIDRRVTRYRGGSPLPALAGRDVIVVDDGLATGVTARAALQAVRGHGPRRVILAAPVCAAETARSLGRLADQVVCLAMPAELGAVGAWYRRFDQTDDDEVVATLARFRDGRRPFADAADG